ncbi:unnamed protein product [Urochloa decumbens]|uniref:RBR-type E3 ubiquitin transferase n=1 Tax=Urochloa decumbens TaxID=240449 RepID=A0ABC8V6L1_9POAL
MSLEPSSSAPGGEVGAGYWALLALQAIYGDDMVILDNMDGLRFFQISLHYQLEGEIQVYMNICTNDGTTATRDEDDDEGDANDGLLYACSLQHLPPITLTCLLPRSYPSTRAPCFVIAAKWLDEPEVSMLCSVLDGIWAELPGQEVVFRWADWLSGSSWSCIASDNQMVLGPDTSSAGGAADERAIGRSLILDSTIPLMHRYSEERSQEAFDQSVHECGVCLSENTGRNFIRLPCNHSFCVKCMESYCGIHVKEGSVATLACPDTSCRAALPPPVLRRLLGGEGYARWESLALRRTLDTMPDVAYCPRCNAACVVAVDDAQCPACFFTFCAQCCERRHVGDACVPTEEKLDDLLEQQKLTRASERELWPEARRRREQRKVEELLSLREVLRSTRQCPSCRMAIAKTGGCNKMVCHNCGNFFCYRCCRAISGYRHFVDGGCGLFDRVRLPGTNNDRDLDEAVEMWMRPLSYTCPACGAKRAKAGANNLLVCRTCQARYCALCRKRVWEVYRHYGPGGDCQQRR